MPSDNVVIDLQGVTKRYGAFTAVNGVDLQVRSGALFGLIGHNGAGKSTLFKMMLGLITPDAGDIRITGTLVRERAFRAVRRRIGYLPENLVLYDNLSGLETLRFFARLKGADLSTCPTLLDRVGLTAAGDRPVRAYSKGMRQRLGLAQALLASPQVLFLDEPGNGLDPAAIRDFYVILHELRQQGTTVVITSHILNELEARVDRLAIMVNGRVCATGSVQELRDRSGMPLTVRARVEGATVESLRAAVPSAMEVAKDEEAGSFALRCTREAKMPTLAALHGLGSRLTDIQVREPSLEDLFFTVEG